MINWRPFNGPVIIRNQAEHAFAQLFSQGQFSHTDGKAKFIATMAIDPVHQSTAEYPLITPIQGGFEISGTP